MDVGGIILAGGKSNRMGQDKGLLDFKGKKLVEYAIELLHPLCSEILISSNQKAYDGFGLPVVADNYPDCGPIAGLEAALRQSKYEWNIVVSCDTPFLQPALFQNLLNLKGGVDAVIPVHDNGIEPLAALYHRGLQQFFHDKIFQNEFKLRKIIRERKVKFWDANVLLNQFPHLFNNLNSPEDMM